MFTILIAIVLCKNAMIIKIHERDKRASNHEYTDYFLCQFIRAVSKLYWYLYVTS